MAEQHTWGLGRRKTAVARVRIRQGSGKILINKRNADEFFVSAQQRNNVRKPFKVTDLNDKFDVFANVHGGGVGAQAEAVRLGISRALIKVNKELEPKLKEHDLLTRDSRMKERKKYGLRGARRGTQFSKR
ncbi:MAG: 30S ribosomal protein S9 [Planctomycetes bacterium]|nr:30S ribosomal protein S9 [Planctomycetota bacterium]MCW8136858.1 30S ribosomal protein S9 [Planctomycetota bacterium]